MKYYGKKMSFSIVDLKGKYDNKKQLHVTDNITVKKLFNSFGCSFIMLHINLRHNLDSKMIN